MNITITATYIDEHYNYNANYFIPGYWIPDLNWLDGSPVLTPCGSEREAIAHGELLVSRGETK